MYIPSNGLLTAVSSVLDTGHKLSVLTESDLRTAVRDTLVEATRGTYQLNTTYTYHNHILNVCLQDYTFLSLLEIGLSDVLSHSSLPPSLNNLPTAVQTIVGKWCTITKGYCDFGSITSLLAKIVYHRYKFVCSDIHSQRIHVCILCNSSYCYPLQMLLNLHE